MSCEFAAIVPQFFSSALLFPKSPVCPEIPEFHVSELWKTGILVQKRESRENWKGDKGNVYPLVLDVSNPFPSADRT